MCKFKSVTQLLFIHFIKLSLLAFIYLLCDSTVMKNVEKTKASNSNCFIISSEFQFFFTRNNKVVNLFTVDLL